jgi:charged multivesicular body protein 2A
MNVMTTWANTYKFCLQLKLPQMQKIMMEFEKQTEMMEMKEEMMNDAIDDTIGEDNDEEERLVLMLVA